jgi:MoxR-like ATPase
VEGEISMNEMQAHQPEPSSDIAAEYQDQLEQIRQQIATVIVGQQPMVEAMLCAMLSRGHILLEGVPGLAKSLAVATFSQTIGGDYNRIQFTPDKLPSDITGTMVYDERENNFVFHPGPVFCNILLADEINRASPKVQSALLESLSFKKVLERGYTVVWDENDKPVTASKQLESGQKLNIEFKDGKAKVISQ